MGITLNVKSVKMDTILVQEHAICVRLDACYANPILNAHNVQMDTICKQMADANKILQIVLK